MDALAVDTETTGLRPWQGDTPIMASFADDSGAWALPPAESAAELRRAVDAGRRIVLHNSTFDRSVFSSAWGIEIPDEQVWDTQGVDWMLDENADHRLKEGLGYRLFGVDAKAEKEALKAMMRGRTQADVYKELRAELEDVPRKERESAAETRVRAKAIAESTTKTWADMDFDSLKDYAEQDADLTYRAYCHQQLALPEDGYVVADLDRQHLIAGQAYRIQRTGIRVDEEMAERERAKAAAAHDELARKFEGVLLTSSQQVAKMLYDDWGLPCSKKTKTGGRSTDKGALEELTWDPRVESLVEFRQLDKQLTAYYNPLLDRVGRDGRIHPSLNPHRTVTGRFSCSGPNLQTIPRESTAAEIRKVFIPDDGMVLTEWDLSQIEVRVVAAMSKEPALLDVYAKGLDVYQTLADEIGVDRHTAKTVILSAQYGVRGKTLAATLAKGTGKAPNVKRANAILDRYWATYRNVDRLFKGLEEQARRKGYIALWRPGRRRVFRSPANPFPRYYSALNAAVQGGAADLLKDVLLELEPAVTGVGRIVLTVHDSVVVEHEPGAEAGISELIDEITKDCSPYAISTPWEAKQWK